MILQSTGSVEGAPTQKNTLVTERGAGRDRARVVLVSRCKDVASRGSGAGALVRVTARGEMVGMLNSWIAWWTSLSSCNDRRHCHFRRAPVAAILETV